MIFGALTLYALTMSSRVVTGSHSTSGLVPIDFACDCPEAPRFLGLVCPSAVSTVSVAPALRWLAHNECAQSGLHRGVGTSNPPSDPFSNSAGDCCPRRPSPACAGSVPLLRF